MGTFLALLSLLFPSAMADGVYNSKPKTVAVIDTGFGYKDLGHDTPLCKFGHKDFTIDRQFTASYATKTLVPVDLHSHGTNIAGLITKYAGEGNYCLIIIKYYSEAQTGSMNLRASIKALKYANNLKVDFVNYSGGGEAYDEQEAKAVKSLLKNNATIVVAAMNENKDIDLPENHVYPAQYDKRIVVVGNNNVYGVKSKYSNFGKSVNRWELGENQEANGIVMTGTSQATAVATGKLVAESLRSVIDRKNDVNFGK